MSHYQTIQSVILSERSNALAEKSNKFTFKVAPSANKVEIAKAVKALFGVEVAAVNTMNYAGKAKRQRTAAAGYRSDWKKAVVTLKPGQQLNLI
ncbi:MAG: ribosomal protein [Verrucomicrobiota bacterium]|jgi:large subunit ribosomal protein L23